MMNQNENKNLRRFLIDTDTGSDDVWAVIEALRATEVARVEAITVVCGNLPLDLCVKNAMLAVDAAGTYAPPVYRGMEHPLCNPVDFYAPEVHGEDGLGGMNLPPSPRPVESKHAVDAIIDLVMANPGEIEIVTCGPLTNLAVALQKEEKLADNIKKVWILGGSASGTGNMTPYAEYNVYVDPEAADIVLQAGMDTLWVTWDSAVGDTEITPEELAAMQDSEASAALFCARCSRTLREYYRETYGRESFAVIDSMVMTAALFPEIMEGTFQAGCTIELTQGEKRGCFSMEPEAQPNATICPAVHVEDFKRNLFALLGVGS
ncbi:MAG: nucleoside hydrolase [Ruminiclostridium sp.]|nr:nucleoside hydrolase [Ruminiclostridium sp.]